MKHFFVNNFKTAVYKVRNSRSGLTLIELVVAMAISSIMMGVVVGIFFLTYQSYSYGTEQAQAQNLAVLTLQKIEDTVRYKNTVNITHIAETADTSIVHGIYYSSNDNGIMMDTSVYQKKAFKGYTCVFSFSKGTSSNLLKIEIAIKNSKGNQLFDETGSLYLLNGTTSGSNNDNALTIS